MVSSKFESLLARPPTPPHQNDNDDLNNEISDVLDLLDDPYGTKQLLSKTSAADTLLNTPVQSPSSELGSSVTSSRKKRVNFELQTCAIPKSSGLISQSWTPRHCSPLRPLPQTRVSRPLKSILKPSDPNSSPPPTNEDATPPPQTFVEMLESAVKMLAGGARPSKLDAYLSLQGAMQAYEKMPDPEALSNKMGLLTQFIRRDMQAVGISGSGPDSQMISQTLKFLMALMRINELKTSIDDDFCSFVVDRCIAVGSDANIPKAIINTHLAVLMQQNFRQRVMTFARVERILDLLDSIHDRVTGYSVQAYRIRIYRKLIQQKPDVMAKHTERWFKHILKAMLSSGKEMRQSALDTALSAARTIGDDPMVTKSILTILNRIKSDGDPFATAYAQELDKSLKNDNAIFVPPVWGVITALLRGSLQDEAFPALKKWLQILENALRGSDNVRHNANVASTFLIYAVNPTDKTSSAWSQMLLSIPKFQMERFKSKRQRNPGNEGEQQDEPDSRDRDIASSIYLTLLYYAFRPAASHEHLDRYFETLDRYWKEYVDDFWTPMVHASRSSTLPACRIVSTLFKGSKKPWNEHRALEFKVQSMVQRDELPVLEPRWVRKRLAMVLQFVETLIVATPWNPNALTDEPVKTMWISLLDSLVEAGSKEVMATSETKDAVAHVVNMLRRMWDKHTAKLALPQQKEDSWADKFCFLLESVVQKLGPLQFADKCLTRNLQDEFEVAPTPSGRSRHQGPRLSPLLYFLDLLILRSEGKLSDTVRLRVVQLILEPCLATQNTRLAKLDLLRDCSAAMNSSSANTVASKFWDPIATLTKSCIAGQGSDFKESRQFGKEFETVVDILALGSSYFLSSTSGPELLSTFVETVRRDAGEGAVVLAVIEQVSRSLLTPLSKEYFNGYLAYVSILLSNLPPNMSRRMVEQGRQNLYPSSPAPTRTQEYDPYNHLYAAIIPIGSAAYNDLVVDKAESTRGFLVALATSIRKSPVSLLGVYLRKIQEIIKIWVQDPKKKLRSKERPIKQLRREVVNLWQAVNEGLGKFQKRDSSLLVALESLLCAGFESRRRSIVNISVVTWNGTFGKDESLRYPAHLEEALMRLRSTVELSAPALRDIRDATDPLSFDSDSSEDVVSEKPTSVAKPSPYRIRKSLRVSQSPAVHSPDSRRTSARHTPKVRLRHDNSQMQFELIASSPSNPFNQESQMLTDRQKEMLERQKTTSSIFLRHGTTNEAQDDLPFEDKRTPLKSLAALGPMDVYLGSSPTPQSRTRSQQIVSDETDLATPKAVRTIQNAGGVDELGSSPPQFETPARSTPRFALDGGRQPERPSYSLSFDAGTPFDDGLLPDSDALMQEAGEEINGDDFPTELESTDVPSSTIELQLNAQLNADLSAREATPDAEESHNVYVDAPSQRTPSQRTPSQRTPSQRISQEEREGDSVGSPIVIDNELPTEREVEEVATPAQPPKRKRGRPPKSAKKNKKAKTEDVPAPEPDPDHTKDTNATVVAPPSTIKSKRKRRKSLPQGEPSSQFIVPETTLKPAALRAASSLSQTEAIIEDTPVPKRTRKNASQDVSEAKTVAPADTPPSQVKVLSHVQVTPRASSSLSPASSFILEKFGAEIKDQADDKATVDTQTTNATTPLKGTENQSQQASVGATTPSASIPGRTIKTPKSLMARLKDILSDVKHMVLGKEEEREIDDAMFDLRCAVRDAGRRGQDPDL